MVSNARKEKFARQVAISKMEPAVTTHYKGDVVPPPVFAELQELKDANADLNERNRKLHSDLEVLQLRSRTTGHMLDLERDTSNGLRKQLTGERNRHAAAQEHLFKVKAAFICTVLAIAVMALVVHLAQPVQTIAKCL